jgi:hypothetical protein
MRSRTLSGALIAVVLAMVAAACQASREEAADIDPLTARQDGVAPVEEEWLASDQVSWYLVAAHTLVPEASYYPDFLDRLRATGRELEFGDSHPIAYFEVDRQAVKVAERTIYVFEYDTRAEATAAAANVSPDGFTVRVPATPGVVEHTILIPWMGAPRFYLSSNLIVIYPGRDEATRELLADLLGPFFAGR